MHDELVSILGEETVDAIALILIGMFIMWFVIVVVNGK